MGNGIDKSRIGCILKKFQQEVLSKEPYRLNLVDEIGANENAHTRILLRLLAKIDPDTNRYIFLESFLRRVAPTVVSCLKGGPTATLRLETQTDYIDLLIACPGSWALVIENKINGAIDQNRQIEGYLKGLIGKGYKANQLFALYLTADSGKVVSDVSLTKDAKDILGCKKEDAGRFLTATYKEDILDWLQEDVLPMCRVCDEEFVGAVRQYIAYLANRFLGQQNAVPKSWWAFCHEKEGLEIGTKTRQEEYKGLRQWLNDLSPDETEKSVDDPLRPSRIRLLEYLDRNITYILSQDYTVDYPVAAYHVRDVIRKWLVDHDARPNCWYDCVFVPKFLGKARYGIKLQFGLVKDTKEPQGLRVIFWDNDGGQDSLFEQSFHKTVELVKTQLHATQPEGRSCFLEATIGSVTNEQTLIAFLDKEIPAILKCYQDEFNAVSGKGQVAGT